MVRYLGWLGLWICVYKGSSCLCFGEHFEGGVLYLKGFEM